MSLLSSVLLKYKTKRPEARTANPRLEVIAMAAKKMFPPGEVDPLLEEAYDEFELKIDLHVQAGQIVMQFSDHVKYVRMRSAGARKLATLLLEKANEIDQSKSRRKPG